MNKSRSTKELLILLREKVERSTDFKSLCYEIRNMKIDLSFDELELLSNFIERNRPFQLI